jgi:hypothetical protein
LPDPAYQKTQRIDRGFIGPMDVLDDQRGRRRLAQLIKQGIHDLVALTELQRLGQARTHRSDQVPKRAKGARRTECVAGTDQHPRSVGQL